MSTRLSLSLVLLHIKACTISDRANFRSYCTWVCIRSSPCLAFFNNISSSLDDDDENATKSSSKSMTNHQYSEAIMRFLSHMIAQAGGRWGTSAPHSSNLSSVAAATLPIILMIVMLAGLQTVASSDGSILKLVHRYSDRKGSSKEGGMSEENWQLLLWHDELRHRRSLASAVYFSLEGSYDPTVAGLYYTEIGLGTPLKSYLVQVDTGSDVMWINCKPCTGCPQKNAFGGPMNIYDPKESSTMSMVGCSDHLCAIGEQAQEAFCTLNKTCGYFFQYGDGSITEGQYLRDEFKYMQLNDNNSQENTTTKVIFGCSFSQSGSLANEETIVDGLIGFGQLGLSIPSQLAAQGKTPRKFAHCLEGQAGGGGILVVGEVAALRLQYTPLVPNSNRYNVNLRSLAVNGVNLLIDTSLFTSGPNSGVIFDSGTTFTYLPQRVYDVFVEAVIEASTAQHIPSQQDMCFSVFDSLDASFPTVSLNFEGASMQLKPIHYLLQKSGNNQTNFPLWCIGWMPSNSIDGTKTTSNLAVLGDLVLKDQLIIYDLENQQIGWVDYNCSSGVQAITSPRKRIPTEPSNININMGNIAFSNNTSILIILALIFVCTLYS